MLLALQCHERGIAPQRVAGFRTWLKLGRCVRRGEVALRILAPVTVKQRDEQGEETDQRRVFFRTAFVFDVSQTQILDGAEPVSLEAPREPLTGTRTRTCSRRLRRSAGRWGTRCRSRRSTVRRAAGVT